jgi:hypothetical protein
MQKKLKCQKTNKVECTHTHTHTHRLTQTRTVTCYMRPPTVDREDAPWQTKPQLTTTKIWTWATEGLSAKTDCLTVSCKVGSNFSLPARNVFMFRPRTSWTGAEVKIRPYLASLLSLADKGWFYPTEYSGSIKAINFWTSRADVNFSINTLCRGV